MESAPGPKTLIDGKEILYFCGTGYFAFQGHPEVVKAACDAVQKYGVGTATSRSGYGNNPVLLEVEERAARFFEEESALYYVSGYLGNAILLQGLAAQYDVIFVDEESHYSVRDGASIANKPIIKFAHCDAEDLSVKLSSGLKPSERPLVISDGIFPVSGEVPPLDVYVRVLENYDDALICVDDAHATGVIGEKGQGTFEYLGVQGEGRYSSGTLSKAFGGHGGIIAGKQDFIELLRTGSQIPYASSAVPAPAAAATAKAFEILMEKPEIRQQLWDNVCYAKDAFRKLGFDDIPDNPIPIVCLSSKDVNLERIQKQLFEKRIAVFYVPGGSYSSVPEAGAIRVAIFSSHTKDQIAHLVTEMKDLI
jgi:7-keto-8-aminopelargonate synthetase-like enzyme